MAATKKVAGKSKKSARAFGLKRNVVPDKLDLRDRPYIPSVAETPTPELIPRVPLPVLNQTDTSACTGFALASVVHHLLRVSKHKEESSVVSPFMLYSMARRYDEFPGDPGADTGSSLRGVMKGWYKHGACAQSLWKAEGMPDPKPNASNDWWLDAVKRPLGAYYRVEKRSATDMHVALHEVGILLASALCHAGWDEGYSVRPQAGVRFWSIPHRASKANDMGHAFVIVGYNSKGFIIQNSWGAEWGSRGRALISYDDWLENAMDCWVAQLGVVTDLHLEIAKSTTLRVVEKKVQLAVQSALRRREISPFVINLENNGKLSNTGEFRTQESDLEALVTIHLEQAKARWNLGANDAADIAIYAHGGLTGENDAAETAAEWIPALYDARIFPIFLMWETDLWSTLRNRLEDIIRGQLRPAGGVVEKISDWFDQRIERLLTVPGSLIWGEMKQNAEAMSKDSQSGLLKFYDICNATPELSKPSKVRWHLIGHSAGSIVHNHIVERLCPLGWEFQSINFMAPAIRVDSFRNGIVEAIKAGVVKRYNQFHLTDQMEQNDPTCRPILGYSRSLLYLVSRSFERGRLVPILGLEKDFTKYIEPLRLPGVRASAAPSAASNSTTHGGFDNDTVTIQSIIGSIKRD